MMKSSLEPIFNHWSYLHRANVSSFFFFPLGRCVVEDHTHSPEDVIKIRSDFADLFVAWQMVRGTVLWCW